VRSCSLRLLLAFTTCSLALVVLAPAPASAHASLVSTVPAAGAVVDAPPRAITLQFNESVEVPSNAIRVYDSRGQSVDVGEASHPDGASREVRASVPKLENGTYVVTWRAVSADAHPIRASFVFTVGSGVPPSELQGLVDRLLADQGGSTATGVVYGVIRGVVFGGLAVLVGGAAFLLVVWPAGRDSHRVRKILWAAWGATLVATVASIGVEGAYVNALPLGDALDGGVIGDALDTRYGQVMILRAALLVLAIPLLRLLVGRHPAAEYPLPRWWAPTGAAVGALLMLTPGIAGHAATGRWVALAVPADAIHLIAVGLWLGGLIVLGVALLPVASADELRSTLPRYSRMAFACIVVIVVSGTFQAFRQIGSIEELRSTDYGRLFVIKLLTFGALLIVAAFSREIVNRTFRAPRAPEPTPEPRVFAGAGGPAVGETTDSADARDPDDASSDGRDDDFFDEYDFDEVYDEETEARRLRRSVLLEVLVAAGILAVTALLVNAAPARTAPVEGRSTVILESSAVQVELDATPGSAGTNELHVTALDPNGTLMDVEDLSLRASLPDNDIAPIDVELRELGPGHYVANDLTVPLPGDWRFEAQVTLPGNVAEALEGTLEFR
jgi:copper transport protein